MILGRILLTALLAFGAAFPAVAAERCLSRAEQRARAAAHAVVPLSRAMHAVRKRGEVIRARLCEHTGHLVYLLTVLERDGKVAQASVDAASGTLVGAHPHERAGKDKTAKAAKEKDAKERDAKDKVVRDKEAKDAKDAKDKATKDKDAKDAKYKYAKDKDAKDAAAKDKETKDNETQGQDAKDKATKDRDAQKAPK